MRNQTAIQIEIKGFQRLEDIPLEIQKEVERQQNILEIQKKMFYQILVNITL